MKYRVEHRTHYLYGETVSLCHNLAHIIPLNSARQHCLERAIDIAPRPHAYQEHEDYFGNRVIYFSIEEPHTTLTVTIRSLVELHEVSGQLPIEGTLPWDQVRDLLRDAPSPALRLAQEYRLPSPMIEPLPELADYAQPSFPSGRPLRTAVRDLTRRIHREFTFDPHFSSVATPLTEVLAHRRGVCQDFAHLAIGCLRSMGLAARYQSGYLETLPPPGKPRLVGADASHAWFSAFDPEEGWLEFDPTNDRTPDHQYITVAQGRDYADVAPLKGVIFGGGKTHQLKVAVDVISLPDG